MWASPDVGRATQRFSVVPIADLEGRLAAWAGQAGVRAGSERPYGGYAVIARLTHC